jgi:hypothetical protein
MKCANLTTNGHKGANNHPDDKIIETIKNPGKFPSKEEKRKGSGKLLAVCVKSNTDQTVCIQNNKCR